MGNIVPMVGLAILLGIYLHFFVEVFEPKSVHGQRVLITGASSGIGEQLAYQYSRLGAKVFITARRENLLKKVADECQKLGAGQVAFMTSDLVLQTNRDALMKEVSKQFGGLDILILNHAIASAGLWLGSEDNVTSMLKDMDVNFVSYVDIASKALPLLERTKGRIGVVSSVAGKVPIAALGSYSADKFALQGFFGALRVEMYHRGTGVTVTMSVIGPVDTDMLRADGRKERVRKMWFWGLDLTASPQDTADAIIAGVATRQREIYHGMMAWILVTLHQLCPGLVENWLGAGPTMARMG